MATVHPGNSSAASGALRSLSNWELASIRVHRDLDWPLAEVKAVKRMYAELFGRGRSAIKNTELLRRFCLNGDGQKISDSADPERPNQQLPVWLLHIVAWLHPQAALPVLQSLAGAAGFGLYALPDVAALPVGRSAVTRLVQELGSVAAEVERSLAADGDAGETITNHEATRIATVVDAMISTLAAIKVGMSGAGGER